MMLNKYSMLDDFQWKGGKPMKSSLKLATTVYERQTKNLLLAQPFEKGQIGKKIFTRTAPTICSRILQIFIFLIFISATAKGQTPLNPNGGFEDATLGEKYYDEIPGWELYSWFSGTGTFEVVDDPVKEGDRALCVDVTELGTLSFSVQAINFPFPVEPNTEYTYSVWAKANKEGSVLSFLVEDPSYNIWAMEESVPMTTEWQFITFTFTTPDTATSGRAPVRFSESANEAYLPVTFYIDDLQIMESVQNDVGVLSLNIPTILQFGQSMPIDITIKNFGTQTQSNFPVSYSINGGTPVTENFIGSLPAGSSAPFIFTEQWSPQVEDKYNVLAWTDLTNDEDQSNDTAEKEVTVTTISDQGLKLYLDGDSDNAKLSSSVPDEWTYELTVTNYSSTITYGDCFLTDDIISGTDYTLYLLCASTSTKDFTAVVKIGNQEVVNTTFSVSGAQYKYYEISVEGIYPNITSSAEVELLVTVNGEGFGVTSGIKWGAWIDSYIIIPSQSTQITVDRDPSLPNEFCLSQNYPNPFNPSTIIRYTLQKSSHTTLKIYNLFGQELETLVNEFQTVGEHEINWQPQGLPSGIYFYRLQANDPSESLGQYFSETKKLILRK